jgi:hypothetical protein
MKEIHALSQAARSHLQMNIRKIPFASGSYILEKVIGRNALTLRDIVGLTQESPKNFLDRPGCRSCSCPELLDVGHACANITSSLVHSPPSYKIHFEYSV